MRRLREPALTRADVSRRPACGRGRGVAGCVARVVRRRITAITGMPTRIIVTDRISAPIRPKGDPTLIVSHHDDPARIIGLCRSVGC